MSLLLRDVIEAIEGLYPTPTAMSWDRVGLVTGDPEQPIRRIHLAVDPTRAVVAEAIEFGADLLVTHHPLLLRGIHSVATTTAKGAILTQAIVADLAIYCAHTNADVADPGVSDALAAACGLTEVQPLSVDEGQELGRVGLLREPISLREFATRLADALPAAPVGVRVSGDPDATVCRVAVMGGSGDDRFADVRACGADVYVTADLRHHPALEARDEADGGKPFLIDAGHWATEWLWLGSARDRLLEQLTPVDGPADTVEITISSLRTDPWDFLVSAATPGSTTNGGPR